MCRARFRFNRFVQSLENIIPKTYRGREYFLTSGNIDSSIVRIFVEQAFDGREGGGRNFENERNFTPTSTSTSDQIVEDLNIKKYLELNNYTLL